MASPLTRAKAAIHRARHRSPLLDHAVRTQQHYNRVNGSGQAGAITYYGFLSFFPILAIAFFVVGSLAQVFPSARDNLVKAISDVLPGIVGPGGISLQTIEQSATTVGLLGLLGLLYAGLGWLSSMRTALELTFEVPRSDYPSFVMGKARDLVSLVVVGVTMIVSVGVTEAVVHYTGLVVDLVGAGRRLSWLVGTLGVGVALLAGLLVFYALFRLLGHPPVPRRALWQGALLGAIGFEVLKLASGYLLAATKNQPAFQAFGIALILLVWINYFSRVVVYAAAWAQTSPLARAARAAERQPMSSDTLALRARVGATRTAEPSDGRPGLPATGGGSAAGTADPRVAFGAGAATALGLVAVYRHLRR